jgi:hypothetical protein
MASQHVKLCCHENQKPSILTFRIIMLNTPHCEVQHITFTGYNYNNIYCDDKSLFRQLFHWTAFVFNLNNMYILLTNHLIYNPPLFDHL